MKGDELLREAVKTHLKTVLERYQHGVETEKDVVRGEVLNQIPSHDALIAIAVTPYRAVAYEVFDEVWAEITQG